MQLNLDKKNKKILFFFLISLFTISILLFLSFNGFWSLTHGPLYFFLGDGINSNGELSSTIYVKPDNFDVYTFQIGIAYLHFLSIFLLNENWFIFYIAFISFIWSFVLNKVYSELQKFNLNNLDISIILFIIFFQPYNLNQIANFSNESIYFPLLIYFFFFSLNLANQSLNNVIANNKLNICIFLIFLLFGSFFRLHHLVFFGSIILFYLISKRYDLFLFFSFFLFITLILKYFIIINSNLESSIETIRSFLYVLKEVYLNKTATNLLPSDHFIQKDILLNNILNSISNLSFYLYIKKFVDDIYFAIIFSTLFSLIPIISICLNMKKNLKYFSILSLIFLISSSIFIFILPMFEYSYLLPSTFLVVIFNFILFKKIFKDHIYKIFGISFISLSFFLVSVFSGFVKFKNIEIYSYRLYANEIIKFSKKINKDNSLVYFNEKLPSMPEIYRWYFKFPICNFELNFEECKTLRNIREIDKIYIIVTEDRTSEIKKKFLKNNFEIKKMVENKAALQKYYILENDQK